MPPKTTQDPKRQDRNPSERGLFSDPWKFVLPAPPLKHRGHAPVQGRGRLPSRKVGSNPKTFYKELGRTLKEAEKGYQATLQIWSAVRACLAILADGKPRFILSKKSDRAVWEALLSLGKRLALRALHRGPDDCAAWVKEGATSCRRRVAEGKDERNEWTLLARLLSRWCHRPVRHCLLQLSYLGRSVPPPSSVRATNRALRSHKTLLTSPDECPLDVLDDLEAFAYDWAKNKNRPDASWDIQITGGAAIGFPRSKGGHQANIAGAVWEAFSGAERPDWVEPDVWQTLAGLSNVRLALTQRLEAKYPEFTGVPPGEVIPIPEPGNKFRVVSRGDSDFVTITHSLRTILFNLLRQDPTINSSLRGDDVGAVEKAWRMARKQGYNAFHNVVSSDMTVATDGIYQSAYSAVWNGIAKAIGLSEKATNLGAMAIGPQDLKWTFLKKDRTPDHIEEARTTRGALMGNPIPWSLLCVIHRWAAETAIASTLSGKRGHLFRKAPYQIFGDDAIAFWPRSVEREYARNLGLVGASLSSGKHFISPRLCDASCVGFFCEKGYIFNWPNDTVERTQTYPLKGLTHAGGAIHQENGLKRDRGVPSWATVGPTLRSLLLYDPKGFRGLRWATRLVHPGLSKWYISKGILPYLPRELGGAGLIPRKGPDTRISELAPARHRKVLSDLYCSESPDADWGLFERVWKSSQIGRHQRLSIEFTEGVWQVGAYRTFWKGAVLPNQYEDVGLRRDEVEDRLNHWWRKGFLMMMGPDMEPGWKIRPTSISKSITEKVASYPSAGWAKPLSHPSIGDILSRRLWHRDNTLAARRVTTAEGVPLDTYPRDEDEVRKEVLAEYYDGEEPEGWSDQIQLDEIVARRRLPDLSQYSDSLIKGRRTGSNLTRQREIALALGWEAFLFG